MTDGVYIIEILTFWLTNYHYMAIIQQTTQQILSNVDTDWMFYHTLVGNYILLYYYYTNYIYKIY